MLETEKKSIIASSLNKEFDINLAITVLKKNFFIPLIILLLGLGISFVYLRYTKPVYESKAVIQRSTQDEGKRILDIEGFEKEQEVSEDVELLKSTFLLEKALKNLNLQISYFAEGQILTEEKYLMSSYHVTLLELRDSSLIGKPVLVTTKGSDVVNLNFTSSTGNHSLDIKVDEKVENEFFSLSFKISNPEQFRVNAAENKLYFVINNFSDLTRRMHPNLQVFALNPEAKTIQINFKSNNHRLSKDVVTSIINTFFQYDLEKKRQSSASILDFIDSQLDTVFLQLKESESAIQNFKDSNSVNDPAYFTANIMERTNELQNQMMDVDIELELIEDIENKVELNDRVEIFRIIPAVTGTDYENLLVGELEELHEFLIEKEDLVYRVTEDHQEIQKIDRKIKSQSENIFRIINTIRKQLEFKLSSLQDRVFKLEMELYGIPAKEMELSRLNRMFSLNEKYYSLLIEKKTQYAISKAGFTMDNMVLQAPTEAVLISPNHRFVYVLSVVLTIMLSMVYLLIRYLTFNDIHEPEELKKLLPDQVGFLGVIPKVDTENRYSTLMVHLKPKSALAESYRHIRSNLQFILKKNEPNLIAVSSSVSGEGKTFVTVNLAGIIAMSGKKVLVIDLDLRKPKVHEAFNADNKLGMSSVLVKSENWKDCVQKSEIEGLDFITAGPIPPNPSELIIGGYLDSLLVEFKKEYDFVIVDNPPVGIVSDGLYVMKDADCPIYMFRANYSKRYYARRVEELVYNKQLNKLFVILNGMESGVRGYGYGYGYGGDYYSDDIKKKKVWQFWKK
ncbi:polysaccharide biosynthesis tyrosine autokinase [Paracrocinitomix mangrovi]|uniref:polysaccharide biosynthesis tyrosine autokinase n=1 Tax=Paracrocinitomix mangrovi TaxID=2862509 RepID=UPI001C8E81BC|nr:polysaccharide biosynthesis tyrosine autokinase [Paracrocinitomix mangrovi]UKN02220.1 polysaccharide biosynthesis tyrosine autokinase [Paracrocinitomix mangrovi]